MRRFGLIGYPLGHSFSKRYFTEKFEREGIPDAVYDLYPLRSASELPGLLKSVPELKGLNVTIPYKVEIIPFLDALDDTARFAGAVNCIRMEADGQLTGFNTDTAGFERSLREFAGARLLPGLQALILGNGGAAKAVAFVLQKLGIGFQFVGRKPQNPEMLHYDELDEEIVRKHPLVVQCTPLGTMPKTDEMPPFPVEYLGTEHFVFDLVYNPAETLFLRRARARGSAVQNGLDMLYYQAEEAWKLWNSR